MTETGLRCQSLDDHERKDYIIIMENEDTAEEIVEEYAEVTTEDVQEAKEESAEDVQVVVSEMTGETAAEILDEEGVICVEEDMELEGLAEDRTRIEGQDGSASEGGERPSERHMESGDDPCGHWIRRHLGGRNAGGRKGTGL